MQHEREQPDAGRERDQRQDAAPIPSTPILSPTQARRLLDDARALASSGRPVAALQSLLSALASLGAPRAALEVFGRAVEALTATEGGGGRQQRAEEASSPSGAAAAPAEASIASLLASLSLEATARLGALEGQQENQGESTMAVDDGGGATKTATLPSTPLVAEEAASRAEGTSVRCTECGAVVAESRAEAHALFWCSSSSSVGERTTSADEERRRR